MFLLLARLAARFKDPADDFRVAIVVDMLLTGFDVPCAHTMYLDKPLAGHNLMQAIARLNRVYGERPSGLIVDLIGLPDLLSDAKATYASATSLSKNCRTRRSRRFGQCSSSYKESFTGTTTRRRSTRSQPTCCECFWARSIMCWT